MDNTLFTLHKNDELLVVQIYVDDIIFGATNKFLCDEFSKLMQKEFEMRMMGELSHFLGLQIKQLKDDIFINQSKYINDMLKKYGMKSVKSAVTPMNTATKLTKDEGGKEVDESFLEVWLDHFFILLQVGQILCLVFVSVHVFNLVQNILI